METFVNCCLVIGDCAVNIQFMGVPGKLCVVSFGVNNVCMLL